MTIDARLVNIDQSLNDFEFELMLRHRIRRMIMDGAPGMRPNKDGTLPMDMMRAYVSFSWRYEAEDGDNTWNVTYEQSWSKTFQTKSETLVGGVEGALMMAQHAARTTLSSLQLTHDPASAFDDMRVEPMPVDEPQPVAATAPVQPPEEQF